MSEWKTNKGRVTKSPIKIFTLVSGPWAQSDCSAFLANSSSDRPQHFLNDPDAVCDGTAILVCAIVRHGLEELIKQIS